MNIQIIHGTTRLVFVLPSLGIAIKLPMINPIRALKEFILFCELQIENPKRIFLKRYLTGSIRSGSQYVTLKYLLLRGIYANYNEERFWNQTKNPFLWPTLFGFIGLINIQRIVLCHPTDLNGELRSFIWGTTNNQADNDGHCFASRLNFTVTHSGNLQMIDYGSLETHSVVIKYGNILHSQSRPLFS